ncbi:MAG: hypothetical protein HRU13_08310 [Phycisphaerales bacterium]|nr:hypothetical protein [Phycisphaerales bacterium]
MPRTTAVILAALAPSALAQPAITIEIDEPVLRPGESTVVSLFAGFDAGDHAMALVVTDLLTSVGSTGWSGDRLIAPMDGPGSDPGGPSATGFDAITAGQLHFPPTSGIYADDSNPIAFWQATYTAPLDPAATFEIDLSTLASRYDVYVDRQSAVSESRLDELAEGSGTITVIPAPASAVVLALGVACICHRRRSTVTGGI